MKKKLKEEAGLTLVEMLAATLVLALLALMLGTGLQMMFDTYETMIAKSEVQLLLSSAVDALADDLRYAVEVARDSSPPEGAECNFTYYSDSYGEGTSFTATFKDPVNNVDYSGQIIAKSNNKDEYGNPVEMNSWQVLPTGAYGSGGAYGGGAVKSYKEYKVTDLKVTCDDSVGEIIFRIKMTVETKDGKISASTPEEGVTVRCLNRSKVTTPAAGGVYA